MHTDKKQPLSKMKKNCQICSKEFQGRSDKKFCSTECKNKFNNELRNPDNDVIARVDKLLHRNHHILSTLMAEAKEKKVHFSKITLIRAGFDFTHFTGTYLNNQGKIYHYIYDFAWMEFSTQEVMVVKK